MSRPKPPTTIRVGPIVYSLEHDHEAMIEYNRTSGDDAAGCTQHRNCRILVDTIYPLAKEQRTVLHEVLHAINGVYRIYELKADSEEYVNFLATALLDLLQLHPELVAYLSARLEGEG